MPIRFANESVEYRAARDRLLHEEIELRRRMEAVARMRRALPPGGVVNEDYVFDALDAAGAPARVKLSELFTGPGRSLIVYSMMFPRDPGDRRAGAVTGRTASLPLEEAPCPSCTALLDQLDGAALHVDPHHDFVVVARTPLDRLVGFARERGWRHLRLLSCRDNGYSRDHHGETAQGDARPMLNVFTRDGDTVRHFWGSEMLYAETDAGEDPRHVGTLEPSWNLFDLTREGRGETWDEQLQYAARCDHCG